MLMVLADIRVEHHNISVIKNVNDTATACIRRHKDTYMFKIRRGLRQGATVSLKLFTTILEYMYKHIYFKYGDRHKQRIE